MESIVRQHGQLPIPKTQSDISVEWMRNAMTFGGRRSDVIHQGFRVKLIGAEMGHMGATYRCHFKYSDASSHSVIVKAPSSNVKILRTAGRLHLYQKEFAFYDYLAPLVPIKTPTILYSQFNDRQNSVLVMEDLSRLSVIDQIEGASSEQAKKVICAIAPLHGKFWNQLEQQELRRFLEAVPARRPASLQLFYMSTIATTFERFDEFFSSQIKRFVEKLGTRLLVFMKNLEQNPRTLIHGDYRLDNMFFGKTGTSDFYVIDWQASRISCGLYDVAYFLCTNVPIEQRRKIERHILAEYHESVCRTAELNIFTFAECWQLYRQYILVCFAIIIVILGTVNIVGPRSADLLRIGVKRLYAAIEDLEVDEFLPGRNPIFSFSNAVSMVSNCVYRAARNLK